MSELIESLVRLSYTLNKYPLKDVFEGSESSVTLMNKIVPLKVNLEGTDLEEEFYSNIELLLKECNKARLRFLSMKLDQNLHVLNQEIMEVSRFGNPDMILNIQDVNLRVQGMTDRLINSL